MRYETTIEMNKLGQPNFLSTDVAKLIISIQHFSDAKLELNLHGTEKALLKLADILIGVAKTPGFHIHLDQSQKGCPVSFDNKNIILTIGNTDHPPKRDSSFTQPPDWARG